MYLGLVYMGVKYNLKSKLLFIVAIWGVSYFEM